MSNSFDIKEISIVISAEFHNPTILSPDFLKYNDIIPKESELDSPPFTTNAISQVVFKDGISISSQPDRLSITELRISDINSGIRIPDIASKYVEIVPHVNYKGVGINPTALYQPGKSSGSSEKFLKEIFLREGPWFKFNGKDVVPKIDLRYNLDNETIVFNIGTGKYRIKSEEISGIICRSNFHHVIHGKERKERIKHIQTIAGNWKNDADTSLKVLNSWFFT